MTELSQEAKDILAEIRESNEAIKPVVNNMKTNIIISSNLINTGQ